MSALRDTRREIFPLFLLFVGVQDLLRVFREFALGISVIDTDIYYSICSAGPMATDKHVSSDFSFVLVPVAFN